MCCRAELNETGYGIMVITPDNFDKPWLHFEAGAISKSVDKAYVSPFLFNIEPSRLVGPLSAVSGDDRQSGRHPQAADRHQQPAARQSAAAVRGPQPRVRAVVARSEEELDKAAETQDLETHTGFPWLYNADDVARRQETRARRRSGSSPRTSTATSSTTA